MSQDPINDTAKTLGEIVEGILEKAPIYEDTVQPTAKALGRGFGGVVLWMMQPFIKLGLGAEKNIEIFEQEAEEALGKIPRENLIAPDPVVSGPILQSLGYTVHHKHLRNMFINLLVNASDNRFNDMAHPAFVEIIKQLSPKEAEFLKHFSENNAESIAIISVLVTKNPGFEVLVRRFAIVDTSESTEKSDIIPEESIDNLERLNIISVHLEGIPTSFTDETRYKPLTKILGQELEVSIKDENTGIEGEHYANFGIIEFTTLGKNFLNVCVNSS
jgi:Abortive infection alpha